MHFRKKSSFILLITAIFISLLLLSCKKSNPVESEELKPGRRDYIWTVDTLPMGPFNSINRIWGYSENDLWAVSNAGDLDKVIWHFDGSKWSSSPIISHLNPGCIYGFSPNDIWIGAIWGEFWHNNGKSWIKISKHTMGDEYPKMGIENIYGLLPNDIYAIGESFPDRSSDHRAFIMHYDGAAWNFLKIPELREMFHEIKIGWRDKSNCFISALKMQFGVRDSNKIYLFNENGLKELYTGLIDPMEWCNVTELDGRVYILIGSRAYKYENDKLVLWKDLSDANFYANIWGRNEKDFFYNTKGGGIGHYNGTDYTTVFKNFRAFNGIILKNSAFFYTCDYNNSLSIVLRGKLQQIKQ